MIAMTTSNSISVNANKLDGENFTMYRRAPDLTRPGRHAHGYGICSAITNDLDVSSAQPVRFVVPQTESVEADLNRIDHQEAVIKLIDAYSRDPMGDGKPLSSEARSQLISGLRGHPTTFIVLAYQNGVPVGIAVCFRAFSTFAARPLMNIHDLNVLPEYRGQGIGRALLTAVEAKAREIGCCKLSLEVQENNHRARHTYAAAGFLQAQYEADAGNVLFLTKRL
jgi:ribosomal protein S18 acetylase RimI-like enzyme